MKPRQAFREYSAFILSPRDTGHTTPEEMADLAIRHVSAEVRQGVQLYLTEKLAAEPFDEALWVGSNARVSPSPYTARAFTAAILARLQDPSVHDQG